MNDDFEKLRDLGAQKIYEQTHITRFSVEKILSKSFDQLDKVRLYGFISILEREYSLDLSQLKQEYDAYYAENCVEEEENVEQTYQFQEKKKRKAINTFIIVVILLGVLGTLFLFFTQKKSESKHSPLVNNTQINKAVKLVESNDTNAVVDTNGTQENLTDSNATVKTVAPQKSTVPTKLEIITTTKLWLGITDLEAKKQTQTVVTKSLELNASKSYLLSLGHGMIKINLGDKHISFPKKGRLWLLYKDGEIKTLTHTEYKQIVKGKTW